MLVTHKFHVRATCPVNGAPDDYEVSLTVDRFLAVEELLQYSETLCSEVAYQEDVTTKLAAHFSPCSVETTGMHSGVLTKCSI